MRRVSWEVRGDGWTLHASTKKEALKFAADDLKDHGRRMRVFKVTRSDARESAARRAVIEAIVSLTNEGECPLCQGGGVEGHYTHDMADRACPLGNLLSIESEAKK